MEKEVLSELKNLNKVMRSDRIISEGEIKEVLRGVMAIMTQFKKENQQLTESTKQTVAQLYAKIADQQKQLDEKITLDNLNTKEEINKNLEKKFSEMQNLMTDFITLRPSDGLDGTPGGIIFSVPLEENLPQEAKKGDMSIVEGTKEVYVYG